MRIVADTDTAGRPKRVLLLYYSYTGQSQKVLQAAGEVFRERGCEVKEARIEFTDPRYAEKFSRFPMRNVWPDFLSMLPAQTLQRTGEITIPAEVYDGSYDLICIGSPTWWRTVNMPLRSFLKSPDARRLLDGKAVVIFVVCRRYWKENLVAVRKLAVANGAKVLDSIHFGYPGGQLRSMLSLTSYLGSGEYKDRYLGLAIPMTNISAGQVEESRAFAARLADRVFGKAVS